MHCIQGGHSGDAHHHSVGLAGRGHAIGKDCGIQAVHCRSDYALSCSVIHLVTRHLDQQLQVCHATSPELSCRGGSRDSSGRALFMGVAAMLALLSCWDKWLPVCWRPCSRRRCQKQI